MNKIQISILVIAFSCLHALSVHGQKSKEYKLDLKSGRLVVREINDVQFIGHEGSEVVLQVRNDDDDQSERAKGLKLINGLGLVDNTGVGLNVSKEGSETVLQQISRNTDAEFVVKVPKAVTIVYEHSSVHGQTVRFKNFAGEIEATTNHSDVELENVNGPLTINTVHGDIEGKLGTINQSNPLTLTSAHGDIDLGIPKATKANFKINTEWGEIYSDLDFKIEKTGDSMKRYGANNVKGTLNGGGVNINVSSAHGSIYLRGI